MQTKLDAMAKELERAKQERYEEEKKNIRLETELEGIRKGMKSGKE